jgi:WD40 repeat protein
MTETKIYAVGGTVQASGGIYISRQADKDLLAHCQAGKFAYVLTARQLGKSSLMVRTSQELAKQGICAAVVDLNELGVQPTASEWYLGLIIKIAFELRLDTPEIFAWWQDLDDVGLTQRLVMFFRDIVLSKIDQKVVVFVDEIDSTLSLDYTDDFFAAVRYMFNARSREPEFYRLSFVLIGVATPGDLIADNKRTPFNIGERVELIDFTFDEARPLAEGLAEDITEAEGILQHILYWTGGHPYLTQRLCYAVFNDEERNWSKRDIARLVEKTFVGEMSRADSNLQFVRDMLTKRSPDQAATLSLYRDIHNKWQQVHDEEQSVIKSHLKLSGVVKRDGKVLAVRNEIYRKVFDRRWVNEHLKETWWQALPLQVKIAMGIVILLVAVLAAVAALAYSNLQLARDTAQLALSRQLITQSTASLDSQYDLSLLLSLEALNTLNSEETKSSVRRGLMYNPYLSKYLRSHQERVTALAFSADGKLMASGSSDSTIILWDMENTHPIGHLSDGHTWDIRSLAVDRDNLRVASGSCSQYIETEAICNQGEIVIWEIVLEEQIVDVDVIASEREESINQISLTVVGKQKLVGHSDWVRRVAFSDKKRWFASVGGSSLILWDSDNLNPLWETAIDGEIISAAFHPSDDTLLAYSTDTGRIVIVDLDTKDVIQELDLHRGRVYDLAFSPDGALLASASRDNTIILWNTTTWQPRESPLVAHADQVRGVEFSSNYELISVSVDAQIFMWDLVGGARLEAALRGHGGAANVIAFVDVNGKRLLASAGPANSIVLWDLDGDPSRGKWLDNDHGSVLGIGFSSDGSVVASAGSDNNIQLWDVDHGEQIGQLAQHHTDVIRRVVFHPSDEYIASAGRDLAVLLWPIRDGQIEEPIRLRGHESYIRSIAFHPNGQTLASSDDQGIVIIWDVATREEIGGLEAHAREVFAVDFNPNGKMLASGSWDGTVKLWDVETLQLIGEPIVTGIDHVWEVQFSPDGQLLAVAGSGDKVSILSIETQSIQVQILTGQRNRINALAFSPEGSLLASGSADSTIVVWNLFAGQVVGLPINLHSGEIYGLAFSPDGRYLASSDLTGKILLSVVEYTEPKDVICAIVNRDLTLEEWFQYIGPSESYRETCTR